MNSNCNIKPQLVSLFDNSTSIKNSSSEKIAQDEQENKFDDPSSDYGVKSTDFSEESELISDSSTCSASNQKRKFTAEEDQKLRQLIEMYGPRKWNQIALLLPGRTGRQCRDRFQNYLNPLLINGPWTKEEDLLLEQKVLEIGQHWNKIAQFFKGRSSNNVKNRWYTHVSKKKHEKTHYSRNKKITKKQYNFLMKKDIKYQNNNYYFNIANYQNFNNYYLYNDSINYFNNQNESINLQNKENCKKVQSDFTCNELNDRNIMKLNILNSNSKNFRKILFPPIHPSDNFKILPTNKGLFNFLEDGK